MRRPSAPAPAAPVRRRPRPHRRRCRARSSRRRSGGGSAGWHRTRPVYVCQAHRSRRWDRCHARGSRPAWRAVRAGCAGSRPDRPTPVTAPCGAPRQPHADRASPGESRRCRCVPAAAAPRSSRRARRDCRADCGRSDRCRPGTVPAADSRWRDRHGWHAGARRSGPAVRGRACGRGAPARCQVRLAPGCGTPRSGARLRSTPRRAARSATAAARAAGSRRDSC